MLEHLAPLTSSEYGEWQPLQGSWSGSDELRLLTTAGSCRYVGTTFRKDKRINASSATSCRILSDNFVGRRDVEFPDSTPFTRRSCTGDDVQNAGVTH